MKTNYLLSNKFKRIGWFLFVPGIVLGILFITDNFDFKFLNVPIFTIARQPTLGKTVFFTFGETNLFIEITCLLLIVGALFIAFSKEKSEDEFISKIRLESLVWATYANYIVLLLTIIFIYDMIFFWVLIFNMFTMLIFFIIRFNWALYKSKYQIKDEE